MDSIHSDSGADSPASLAGSSTTRSSSVVPDERSSGELSGVKIDVTETAAHGFSSLASSTSIASQLSAASGRTTGERTSHSVEQVPSKQTPPDSSPNQLNQEGEAMAQRKLMIQEKISAAEMMEPPASTGSAAVNNEFNRRQQKYINILQKLHSFLPEMEQDEPHDNKIGEVVDFTLELVEAQQNFTSAKSEMQDEHAVHEMSLDLQKAVAFSFQAMKSLKAENDEAFRADYRTSKKCFCRFKILENQARGDIELAKFYNTAFEYYCLSDQPRKVKEESHLLYEAGNHYLSAAQAQEADQPILSEIQFSLGNCLVEQAALSGKIKEKNQNAWNYFDSAHQDFSSALNEFNSNDLRACQRHQSSGAKNYKQGMTSVKEEQDIRKLYNLTQDDLTKISQQKFLTEQSQQQQSLLQQASDYLAQAAVEVREGSQKLMELYKEAGEFSFKGACENIPLVIQQCRQVRDANQGIIEEKKKESEKNQNVTGLFQSAIKYSKIAVAEIKQDPSKEDFITSLEGASSSFFKAAQALQMGDHELSDAYFHCAVSHCYLLVAREPRFINYLSSQEQASFKKETKPNPSLIDHWENVILAHGKKIESLLQARQRA